MLKRSAMPEATKVATVASEILRRWKCSSENLSGTTVKKITKTYMDNLATMGYHYEWRRRVLTTILPGYMGMLRKCKEKGEARNRFGFTTFKKRHFQKTVGKQEW